jgi:hypothetical protein
MRARIRLTAGLLVSLALLSACSKAPEEPASTERAASVEAIKGTNLNRVKMTAKAAERLGIETAAVREISRPGGLSSKVVDYAALIYDAEGSTFVYTNPEPLVYVRSAITVHSIENNLVFFSGGPAVGTSIVTVGVSELFGVDSGVGGNE